MTPERNRTDGNAELLLLSRISNEMVQAQKRYFGRGPTQAKSYLLDDFLLVVMRDGLTTAESTMLDFGRDTLVRSFRQEFDVAMGQHLVPTMQELTGRTIVNYQSQVFLHPYTIVAMFFFEPELD